MEDDKIKESIDKNNTDKLMVSPNEEIDGTAALNKLLEGLL